MANTSLNKNFSAEGDNIYKWTYSFWVKRGSLGSDQAMAASYYSASYQGRILFRSDDQFEVFDYWNGSYTLQKKLNRKFRDTSSWYHIVVSNDNTQASADDRTKIYINGVQETSFATNTQYPQNQRTTFGNDYTHYIGTGYTYDYLDGSMSHIHFIDGTAYDPTAFGETDSTTGEWKIKTDVSVTYGSNGYFILKDGNSVTDQSGNGNNFTVGSGTLTKTEDSPSNVFATMNPLLYRLSSGSIPLSNGNNTGTPNDGTTAQVTTSTLAVNNGKYYAEFKVLGINTLMDIGILSLDNWNQQDFPFSTANVGYSYRNSGQKRSSAGGAETYGDSFTTGDIIGVAFDNTNGTLIFYKNGVSQGTAFTGLTSNLSFAFCCSGVTGNNFSANFGNGYFGTTAVASAGTNASGIGIFEYDVPTGYTALSTKGLNL